MSCSPTPNSTPKCDPAKEPLSSALENFIKAFFGTLTKTCVNGKVVWNLPCNLDDGIQGFPRVPNEGLACYLFRVFEVFSAGVKVDILDTTYGNLSQKIVAGSNITLTVLNVGGDEQLEISSAGGATFPPSVLIAASDIDWSLSNTFYKTLAANTVFTFSNETDGQTIVVAITNTAGNFTASWPVAVQWANGSEPVLSVGAVTSVYTFVNVNGTIFGSVVLNMT